MANEYKWGIVDGKIVLYSAANTDYAPNTIPNWSWRVNDYINNGAPHNGYMPVTKQYPPLEKRYSEYIDLLDWVNVYSPPHGLNSKFSVSEIEIPLNKPEETTYSLGSDKKISLTSANNSANEAIRKQLENMPTQSTILSAAKDAAAALLNTATNGYVTMRRNELGFVEELIISDNPDYKEATNVWVWGINGLGFSSNGYQPANSDSYKIAITSNGSIVADRITTGLMSADRIRGGQLKVGGIDYPSGGEQVGDNIKNAISVYSDNEDYEMRMSGGAIAWYGYNPFDGTRDNHVAHLDSYGVPGGAEYPWLALVCTGGIILNPNNVAVMQEPNGGYVMCPPHEEYSILDMSGGDSDTIEVITNIELDDDGRVSNIEKRTLTLRKLEFTHGLLTDIKTKPR